jgi:two-component system, NtrC family, response regulator AtoC
MSTESSLRQSLQLVVLCEDDVRMIDLRDAEELSIGRGEGCAIRLRDPTVSRNHGVIRVGAKVSIEDLGSANGTTIRDRGDTGAMSETMNIRHLVGRRADLAVGDAIVVGTTSIVLRHVPPGDAGGGPGSPSDVVVLDPVMRDLYAQATRAAPTPINVLLLGETGVGKEVLARAIHARSTRANGPFRAINCAALADSLLESELFGHEKGAFTGALQAREGLFEAAAGGTVLLDEIGELPLTTQAKLLRAVEERAVVRVGSNKPTAIDVRFIAATNRDLEADCSGGRFRPDLYFRLNGLALRIPPLRERPLELEHLARRFLDAACRLVERHPTPRFSQECLDRLAAHSWPGNIRELRNAIERTAILCTRATIRAQDLPDSVAKASGPYPAWGAATIVGMSTSSLRATGSDGHDRVEPLPAAIRAVERARIIEALERSGGVQTEAARALGISRRTLISRIEEFGLPRPRKRGERGRDGLAS